MANGQTLKILAIASGILLAVISGAVGYGKLWGNVEDNYTAIAEMKPEVHSNTIGRTGIEHDIKYINEKLDRLMLESRTSTEALLAELRRINANQ